MPARQYRSPAPRPLTRRGKKGLCEALAAEAAAEVGRLAAAVAASLAGGDGIEAAELAIRAGLTRLGRGVLEDLLAADAGYRGPRRLRGRAPGGVRLLPGEGRGHRARPGHPQQGLVSLR